MKARVKATGEIGIVANIDILFGNKGYRYQSDEVEIINSYADVDTTKDVDYWDKLLHQYAGMAMQGIMANKDIDVLILRNEGISFIANRTIELATALVEKLKEEK